MPLGGIPTHVEVDLKRLKSLLKWALVVMERGQHDRHWDDAHYWSAYGFGGNTIYLVRKFLKELG